MPKSYHSIAMHKIKLFLPIILISFCTAQLDLQGFVFHDRNGNGVMDQTESGIGGQRVSNGEDIVLSDKSGHFSISAQQNDVIFIIKPPNWDIPTNEFGIPKFFHNVRMNSSPAYLKYKAFETALLPETIYFPLVQSKVQRRFQAIISGDPQPRDSTEIQYYREEIIAKMLVEKDMAFYVPLGDIMYDDLSLYPYYLEQVGTLGIPIWHVLGNHDLNYRAKNDSEAHETWNSFFGPDYYSFEYGDVHFIAMNTVYYEGWNTEENKRGSYMGLLTEAQLTWLENDLKYVSGNDRIVLLSHIPIISDVYQGERVEVTNRDALFQLLADHKYLLGLSGHMHYIENMYLTNTHGWNQKTSFQNMVLGAACGAWWYGPLQADGIPYAYHYDGTPNGYFNFKFSRNVYHYDFVPGASDPNITFRISTPEGKVPYAMTDTMQIAVNVFYGSENTVVTCTLDDQSLHLEKQFHAEDPFMNRIIQNNPDHYPEMENMPINNHMWMGKTGKLAKGQHVLRVKVVNDNGTVEKQVKIFEVF